VNDDLYFGAVTLAFAGGVLLLLAWLIGAQGMLSLISNYRAHPERYPDGEGLGRWMGWTLAAGGSSFILCAAAVLQGVIGPAHLGAWVGGSGIALAAGALLGLARYRRMPPGASPTSPDRRPASPPRGANRR
jgi:hypothetical protein